MASCPNELGQTTSLLDPITPPNLERVVGLLDGDRRGTLDVRVRDDGFETTRGVLQPSPVAVGHEGIRVRTLGPVVTRLDVLADDVGAVRERRCRASRFLRRRSVLGDGSYESWLNGLGVLTTPHCRPDGADHHEGNNQATDNPRPPLPLPRRNLLRVRRVHLSHSNSR